MSGWCFALINGRLAEIFFDRKGDTVYLEGYCYVEEDDYKTKKEKKMIVHDTKKCQLVYKNKVFSDKNNSEIKFILLGDPTSKYR